MDSQPGTGSSAAKSKAGKQPERNGKANGESVSTCPVCEEQIVDASERSAGQDSIQCEGKCNKSLHRRCAGLSQTALLSAMKRSDPFQCSQCRLEAQEDEISHLKKSVSAHESEIDSLKSVANQLTSKIADICHELAALKQPPSAQETDGSSGASPASYDAASIRGHALQPQQPASTHVLESTLPGKPTTRDLYSADRKFNLVVFGISECPPGTAQCTRFAHDLNEVVNILSLVDDSIQSHSVKDLRRLGEYKGKNGKPRAVLVKMIRAADASCILSKKQSVPSPFSVKQDIPWEERQRRKTLMNERWTLIQTGVLRSDIRVRKHSILVENKVYGSLDPTLSYQFVKSCDPASSLAAEGNSLDSQTSHTPSPRNAVSTSFFHPPSPCSTTSVYSSPLIRCSTTSITSIPPNPCPTTSVTPSPSTQCDAPSLSTEHTSLSFSESLSLSHLTDMAEVPDPKPIKTVEEIEKEITCAICHGHYQDPKILPCLHYFCADCLQRLVARVGQPVPCPECSREATFDNVQDLLTPFFVNRIIDLHERVEKAEGRAEALCELCESKGKAEAFCRRCECFVCASCVISHDNLASSAFRGHVIVTLEQLRVGRACDVVVASEAPPRKCPEHEEPLKVFCFTCNRLICRDCIIDGHYDHNHKFVRKAAPECRDKLRASLAPLQRGNTDILSAMETVAKRAKEILENQSSVEDVIERSFDELIEALKQQKRQLLHEASILTEERLSALRAQQKSLAVSLAEAQSMVEFVEQSLERATDEEVMEMQQQIISRVEDGCKKQQQIDFEPAAKNDVRVAVPSSATLDLPSVGQVGVNAIDPTKCRVEGKEMEEAEVNKPTEFSLQLADSRGLAVEGPCVLDMEVRSLVDGVVSRATVTPAGNGACEAMYTSRIRGQHSMSVQLNGRKVAGSPFAMFACLPPTQLKQPVKRFGGVRGPYGITISKSGEVIVAERCVGGEVVVFNKHGEKVKAIKHACINTPCGVATDPDGHIYVSSSSPPTVAKFSGDGQTLLVQAKIKSNGEILRMMQVIDGQLFVCSLSDSAVIVLDCMNLNEVRRFGHEGNGNYPINVVAENNELYVSDYLNHRIQVFSMEGRFIRSFTVKDPASQKSYTPRGLCVGPDRLLYAACDQPDRIFAFTLAGECVASVAVEGRSRPAGIAADTDGFLYVCMKGSNCVLKRSRL